MRKILLILVIIISFSNIVNAQIHKFQAAYLYNICKYLEWPAEYTQGDFIIAVLGEDPIFGELEKIAETKKFVNQTIKIVSYKNTSSIKKCHVLYIPTEQNSQTSSAVSSISKFNTLLVTYHKDGISAGAGVNFILKASKLKFEMKKSNITKKSINVNTTIENLAVKKY